MLPFVADLLSLEIRGEQSMKPVTYSKLGLAHQFVFGKDLVDLGVDLLVDAGLDLGRDGLDVAGDALDLLLQLVLQHFGRGGIIGEGALVQ